jgi:MEDS: MEthanogen/methylotroph, DcmR Sensory domain/Histidine kinase-like ATPase domain
MHGPAFDGQNGLRVQDVGSSDGETVVTGAEHLDGGHAVQFYDHDEELADRVASYLRGVLDGRGAAIIIATAAHRHAIEDRLTSGGIDLAAAAQRGDYVALDAAGTLAAFTIDGRLDREGFERVVGGLVAAASRDGRPVRAYGEMVTLLWQAGLVSDAVELEQMWNELARRQAFALLCSYPAGSLAGGGHLDTFAEMCRLHTEVAGDLPAWSGPQPAEADSEAVRAFAFSRDAPAAARHFAVAALRRLGAADLSDDVALVVTELAANAFRHACSGFTLTLSCQPEVLCIAVRDARPLPPGPATATLRPQPLHGLGAVDVLARRWGVEPLGPAGKTVWVELPR